LSGLAVSLSDPATGRRVVFDDCRESDGTMIEAKGPPFGEMLRYNFSKTGSRMSGLIKPPEKSRQAADGLLSGSSLTQMRQILLESFLVRPAVFHA
jgi:hypothetical protein